MTTTAANRVYKAGEIDFNPKELRSRPEPGRALMTTPDFFDIVDVKNPHMEGNAGKTQKEKATEQWNVIKGIYNDLVKSNVLDGFSQINGEVGCEDMVFAANQSLPWITDRGEKIVIISKMRHPSRQREVVYFERFYTSQGYRILSLQHTQMFEGMGDAIPHPGKRLLYGGYGHRTNIDAYEEISSYLNIPIVALELTNPSFYHLDTCFVPLDDDSVLVFEQAFTKEDLAGLRKIFKEVIPVPENEAKRGFALNAHVINRNGKKVAIIQKGNTETCKLLQKKGFDVKEVDTSEFIKSGGSVFCMKMMYY